MLGVVQLCSGRNPSVNVKTAQRLVALAKTKGCGLVCLPEAFDFIGIPGSEEGFQLAEKLDGPLMSEYCKIAAKENIWLSLGGFHERLDGKIGESKIANTHCILNNHGEIVADYRKIHLFDVDYDGGYKESNSTVRGDKIVLIDTPVGRVGLTVCYDLRFPEIFQRLAKAGADVILVPSAFMPTTGKAHWHILLQARAIETQCYIAAAAQTGCHNEKRSSYGHSLIIDPWGEIIRDLGEERDTIAVCDIDKNQIKQIRERMPMNYNRPDLSSYPTNIVEFIDKA
uniref:CN hydrolase domain-containing protein n=1 Tax=Aplanochytrium stocchinoi TaxID=215587 RepID=A0A7S3PME9_9STRA|mmetsp:Transcript_8845/g.11146  ORF Transcript_8845/g.11146 Transcript_8845/m.11146 type:complete len:284 (+) Transcript_8845:134-985(+)|eukprot:CAMPEP_0204827088 /NCGR_PEP_ID=MMETSP1346-20131115/4644_1 /ASSEMBLY_ACC=CAM_ASM_000771 /TAXON_ID=215587 /ORGANISM="Aplanochytrium stocchinoi, Strain GSBS06" /LENGTH=283 /DNA_ID=CAMNT_0051955395 /DNA_START=176 /DNA_END=1027 /DNA_ORIENTATION=+